MIKKTIASIAVIGLAIATWAQDVQKYGAVVDFPVALAGNVGEIRSNHFHSGIDIKAVRGVGSVIMAAADGYVSRVGVSPTGYGNVLYVTHADGQMTVYAHLDRFNKTIANWVYNQQMAKKSFHVNLYPTSTQFVVKRGDVIAYLGNSGSSGGPHLHYEIRDVHGCPINMVRGGIVEPVDNISPNVYSVILYQADSVGGVVRFSPADEISIKQNRDGLWVMSDTLLRASRPFYLAYEVIDYKNGSGNTMGIYSLEQKVDGVVNYSFAIDRISFATTRYINSLVQYDRNRTSRCHVLRAYVSANNALSLYRNVRNRGIITPLHGEERQIETTIEDDAGNSSVVAFSVLYQPSVDGQEIPSSSMKKVEWDKQITIRDSALQVTFAARSLYDTDLLPFSVDSTGVIEIGDQQIPLHRAINVRVKCDIPQTLRTKALLRAESGKFVTLASYDNGWLVADLRQMGRFKVVYDTIAPKIIPRQIKNGVLRWKVSDDISAVGTYELIIDGEWALAQWDPKTSTISHRVTSVSKEVCEHKISLRVSDNRQNTTTLKSIIKW